MIKKRFKTIDEYIRNYAPEVGARLKTIREIVKSEAPEAVEVISYNMPAFKLNGKILLYFAAHEHHIGLYPFPSSLIAFQKESAKYKTGRGSIQFQNDEKLPIPLIKKIVAYRVKEKLGKK